ncbi:MAG: hypothetical protein QXW71_02115 [Thermoplasmata archaeon]
MCVIIYKPRGIELPNDETLQKCWDCNPDGAGIAWIEDGWVIVRKGFMEFEELLKELKKRDWTDVDLVIHFRLMSKGLKKPELCHPFKVDHRIDQAKKLRYRTKSWVLFHNGTLTGFGGDWKSDTLDFANWLGRLKKMGLSDNGIIEVVSKIGSLDRFVLMRPGIVKLIGRWHKKEDCWFSNLSWDRLKWYYDLTIGKGNRRSWYWLYWKNED